jgi:hypothetical protein
MRRGRRVPAARCRRTARSPRICWSGSRLACTPTTSPGAPAAASSRRAAPFSTTSSRSAAPRSGSRLGPRSSGGRPSSPTSRGRRFASRARRSSSPRMPPTRWRPPTTPAARSPRRTSPGRSTSRSASFSCGGSSGRASCAAGPGSGRRRLRRGRRRFPPMPAKQEAVPDTLQRSPKTAAHVREGPRQRARGVRLRVARPPHRLICRQARRREEGRAVGAEGPKGPSDEQARRGGNQARNRPRKTHGSVDAEGNSNRPQAVGGGMPIVLNEVSR